LNELSAGVARVGVLGETVAGLEGTIQGDGVHDGYVGQIPEEKSVDGRCVGKISSLSASATPGRLALIFLGLCKCCCWERRQCVWVYNKVKEWWGG